MQATKAQISMCAFMQSDQSLCFLLTKTKSHDILVGLWVCVWGGGGGQGGGGSGGGNFLYTDKSEINLTPSCNPVALVVHNDSTNFEQ